MLRLTAKASQFGRKTFTSWLIESAGTIPIHRKKESADGSVDNTEAMRTLMKVCPGILCFGAWAKFGTRRSKLVMLAAFSPKVSVVTIPLCLHSKPAVSDMRKLSKNTQLNSYTSRSTSFWYLERQSRQRGFWSLRSNLFCYIYVSRIRSSSFSLLIHIRPDRHRQANKLFLLYLYMSLT